MGLEWVVLSAAVAVEVVLLLIVTLPLPKGLVKNVVDLYRRLLQPMLAILPFALFQLLDIYWKYEHRISCTHEHCTTTERDRFEKSGSSGVDYPELLISSSYEIYKAQRNAILSLSAVFLYWMLFRYVHYMNELQRLEAQVKSVKDE